MLLLVNDHAHRFSLPAHPSFYDSQRYLAGTLASARSFTAKQACMHQAFAVV